MCTRRLRNKYIIQNFPFMSITFTSNKQMFLTKSPRPNEEKNQNRTFVKNQKQEYSNNKEINQRG